MYASILGTYTEIHFENKDNRLEDKQKEKRDTKFVCANDNDKRRVVQTVVEIEIGIAEDKILRQHA